MSPASQRTLTCVKLTKNKQVDFQPPIKMSQITWLHVAVDKPLDPLELSISIQE